MMQWIICLLALVGGYVVLRWLWEYIICLWFLYMISKGR